MTRAPSSSRSRLSAATLQRRTGLATVLVYSRLRSTNSRAAALLEAGNLELPAAVIASLQTSGRGRGSNAWFADAGTLAVTFVFPTDANRPLQQLPLLAGLAALDAVGRYVDASRLRVKWPNDVLADGKKLAGILCERVRGADLIGIGLNVTTNLSRGPVDIRKRATSLAKLTRRPPSRSELLIELACRLRDITHEHDWHHRLNRVHALTGRSVAVDTNAEIIRGTCAGIDSEGRLIVDDGKRKHRIIAGSIVT